MKNFVEMDFADAKPTMTVAEKKEEVLRVIAEGKTCPAIPTNTNVAPPPTTEVVPPVRDKSRDILMTVLIVAAGSFVVYKIFN